MTEIANSRFASFMEGNATMAFSRQPRSNEAFRSSGKKKEGVEVTTSRFNIDSTQLFDSKKVVPAFSESALSAFGKKTEENAKHVDLAFQTSKHHAGFTDDAIMAFGKKSDKKKVDAYDNQVAEYAPLHASIIQRNTLGELLPTSLLTTSNEWGGSVLRTKKPVLATEVEDFPALSSKKTEEEMFPALGSSSSKGTKKAASSKSLLMQTNSPKVSSPKVSFVDLVKKRAEEDAKEEEERKRIMQKQLVMDTKKKDEMAKRRKEVQSLYSTKTRKDANEAMFDDDFNHKQEDYMDDDEFDQGKGRVYDDDDESEDKVEEDQDNDNDYDDRY